MSSLSVDQIIASIVDKLKVTTPGLSLEIGTPERKIVEAVAETVFESQVDNHLVSTQLDIDLKAGQDLDDFVGVFGFGRLQGEYATGEVTLTLQIPAVQAISIAAGTQFFKPGDLNTGALYFAVTQNYTIAKGAQSATVAVRCVTIGVGGNIPGGSVTGLTADLGLGTVNNLDPMTGGADNESDDELRARFKKTFLRNITGTVDFYTGMALQAKGVSRVNVLGPVNTYYTQVQTGAIGAPVTLTSKNCQYVYPEGFSVSIDRGTSSQQWFTEGSDYNISSGVLSAPAITPLTSATANKVLDITYEYASTNSRNNPLFNLMNKIDIFVDGTAPVQITERFITKAYTLAADWTWTYYVANLKQIPSTGPALTVGTKVQRLGSTPITILPTTITVGATTYVLGTNYRGFRDIGFNKGSEREVSGIAWITTAPADGLLATATYTYNQIPEVLNSVLRKSKQVTSDPLVHAAYKKFISPSFVVQYVKGANPTDVNQRIILGLTAYLNTLSYGAWIQLSDLVTFVHNVKGVDNCRMAQVADGAPWVVAELEEGAPIAYYTTDFQLGDNEIAALGTMTTDGSPGTNNIIRRTYNNFA